TRRRSSSSLTARGCWLPAGSSAPHRSRRLTSGCISTRCGSRRGPLHTWTGLTSASRNGFMKQTGSSARVFAARNSDSASRGGAWGGGEGGRGAVLACRAVLAGVPASQAVKWVREHYCPRAVQEPSQEYWMERFAERNACSRG